MRLRDRAVDVVKRSAIPLLHRSPEGEALLMRIYLAGEEQSEQPFLARCTDDLPPVLRPWAARHRSDEIRHATLFRARIEALTGEAPRAMRLGGVSQWKLARFAMLADEGARVLGHPWAGHYAVAWREERMAARVLERHVRVLEARGSKAESLPLLRRVLADERAHVAMCERALGVLVPAERRGALAGLVGRIDHVDRAFGLLGALGLFLTGAFLCARRAVESSTWRLRTRAAT
jgi:hypothetical protein